MSLIMQTTPGKPESILRHLQILGWRLCQKAQNLSKGVINIVSRADFSDKPKLASSFMKNFASCSSARVCSTDRRI